MPKDNKAHTTDGSKSSEVDPRLMWFQEADRQSTMITVKTSINAILISLGPLEDLCSE
jgi:hypothetical protein